MVRNFQNKVFSLQNIMNFHYSHGALFFIYLYFPFPTSSLFPRSRFLTPLFPQDEVYECVFDKYGSTPASVEQKVDGTAVVTCNTPIVQNNMER